MPALRILASIGEGVIATDRSGRVIVEPDLTIPGHPEIFVIGDAAVEPWKPDKPTPGVAQGAIQGGKYAARVIRRRVLDRPYEPYRYAAHTRDRGCPGASPGCASFRAW